MTDEKVISFLFSSDENHSHFSLNKSTFATRHSIEIHFTKFTYAFVHTKVI